MRFRAYLNRIRTILDARQEIVIERFRIDEVVPGRAGIIEPATPPDFGDILREIDKILYSHLDEE